MTAPTILNFLIKKFTLVILNKFLGIKKYILNIFYLMNIYMYKNILILIILLVLIDSFWLYLINNEYNQQITNIQKEPIKINLYSAFFVYLLIAFALLYLTKNEQDDIEKLKIAFVFGITSYGIYDFTNASIFKDWNISLAIRDTIWGGFLCTSSMYVLNKL